MNDTLYQDDFTQTFDVPEKFLQFLEHVEDNAEWRRINTQDLCLCPLEGLSSAPGLSLEIFEDTMHNTGLLVKLNDNHVIPLRSCAIKSLQDRAKISGSALRKVKPDKLSQIFNYCLDVSKGLALVRISSGKVSALLSGDPGDYAILDISDLFQLTNSYLAHYKGQFISGSFEHHLTTAFWTFNDPQLVATYQQALIDYGQVPGTLTAAVRFSSSDVGISGANLYPNLIHNGLTIALGTPLKLEHKNGVTVADFKSKLHMLFSHYEDSIKALVKLLEIDIEYPAQTMIHVAKRLGLPRKLCMPIIETFITQTDNRPCTAHDCYYQLNEIVFLEQCQGVSPSRLVNINETLMRALTLRWSDYDYYSDIVW